MDRHQTTAHQPYPCNDCNLLVSLTTGPKVWLAPFSQPATSLMQLFDSTFDSVTAVQSGIVRLRLYSVWARSIEQFRSRTQTDICLSPSSLVMCLWLRLSIFTPRSPNLSSQGLLETLATGVRLLSGSWATRVQRAVIWSLLEWMVKNDMGRHCQMGVLRLKF